MAVYTKVSFSEAQEFLEKFYSIRDLEEIIEISQGVENTNYILVTKNKKFILTPNIEFYKNCCADWR